MRKKFTLLLFMLFTALCGLPALAQLEELDMKRIMLLQQETAISPDTWYLMTSAGRGGYIHTEGVGNTIMNRPQSNVDDNMMAKNVAGYLFRFVEAEDGLYYIQSGEGCYFGTLTSGGNNGAVAKATVPYKVEYMPDIDGWWIYETQTPFTLDANDPDNPMAGWGTGQPGAQGNNCWLLTSVELIDVSKRELLEEELNRRLDLYEQYIDGRETLELGSEIGQYDVTEEEYTAWTSKVQKCFDILDGQYSDITDEEIETLLTEVDEGWTAIQASRVRLTFPNGNYRIVSAKEWTKTTSTVVGTDPDTEEDIVETVTTHPTKAMYATLDTKEAKWADIDSTDCRYLWNLQFVGDYVRMQNVATDDILDTCWQSSVAKLAEESDNLMEFKYIMRTDDDRLVMAMRPRNANDMAYLHCGSHNNGTGDKGNIVGWKNSEDPSYWLLEPVDDETVAALIEAYAPYKNHELLVMNYRNMAARGDSAITAAKDDQYTVTRSKLIKSAEQMSSPFTCSQQEESKGYKFDFVLDDDVTTFWHSTWQAGSVPAHTHYFQVALEEALPTGTQIQGMTMRRNGTPNDHIALLSVYGATDEGALLDESEDSWTRIDSISFPFTGEGKKVYSENTFDPGEYTYLRFYVDSTRCDNDGPTRGFAHMAEFQLYTYKEDGKTQFSQMGDVATTLEEALDSAKVKADEDVTMDDYNSLKDMVEAFLQVLVDPADLASAIKANENVGNYIVTGPNPGQWPEGTTGDSFNTLLAEATAYLKGGAYTLDKVEEYAGKIASAAAGITQQANQVEAGKWYRFRTDDEENYDTYGWDKSNMTNNTLGHLYGNILVPADQVDDENDTYLRGFSSLADVNYGQSLRFIAPDKVDNADQTAFRFIAVGDSAYIIQHKSGMYVKAVGIQNTLGLSLQPGLFDVKAIGLGKVLVHARNLDGTECGDKPVYLHAQNIGHFLCTWTATEVSTNSALIIEAADEMSEGDDVATDINMPVLPNSMRIWCQPVGYKVKDGALYEYKGAQTVGNEISLAFSRTEAAQPGQPVLYLNGDTTQFDSKAEQEIETVTPTGSEYAILPDSVGGIHGTFAYKWVDEYANVVITGGESGQEGSHFEEATGEDGTDCSRDISAYTGYIVPSENQIENFDTSDYDLVITLKRDPTAITKVTDVLNGRGDIYSMDGKLLKKNGTLSDIKAMGRGLYIIGGAKVAIK